MSSLTVQEDPTWLPTNVQVTVLRARGLRGKGKQGTSDVYTIIQLGKEKYCTGVAEKTTEPEWREECGFELRDAGGGGGGGALQRELLLTVMHRALIGMDVFLGQAAVRLDRVFQDTRGVKNQWFRLNSKTGKKEKERGEIQVSVQFTRNNLTASMYDLVMKDKSASTFSKLKEHMKGKRRSSDKDSSSAVLPGGYGSLYRMRQRLPSDGGGEEDYEDDEGGEARRSKMRTFFLRGKLRKSSDTRSSTSLGSESSESSSRGGSLSPTAGISVVVSDLSNSPSNSSNLTADNSPDHTANTSPKSSSLRCEFGDEAGEISITVPLPAVCVNGSHAPPPDSAPGPPTGSLGLGLLHKPLPLSMSLQNLRLRPSEAAADLPGGPAGDGRRWSFDKPGEEEKAAIAAALEKSGPMLSEEEEEERRRAAAAAAAAEAEFQDRKQQRRNLLGSAGKGVSPAEDQASPTSEDKHKGWFGPKDLHSKPSGQTPPSPVDPSAVVPPPRVSTLHHTNPFCPPQTRVPPPFSPHNPFFSLLQHNPFHDHTLTAQLLPPSPPPPLPFLSSSRPPIAQLFPQTGEPASAPHGPPVSEDPVRRRPLPPVPTQKTPLCKRSSNPFKEPGLRTDSEWDESFEAFAAGRLQPHQNTSGERPEHWTRSQEADPKPQEAGPLASPAFLVTRQVNTSHPEAPPFILETIPEHRTIRRNKLEQSPANGSTDTNGHQGPRCTSCLRLGSTSPDATSSGLGSSAEEDFTSSQPSSSEETETNVLDLEKFSRSAVVRKRSGTEDRSKDPSWNASNESLTRQQKPVFTMYDTRTDRQVDSSSVHNTNLLPEPNPNASPNSGDQIREVNADAVTTIGSLSCGPDDELFFSLTSCRLRTSSPRFVEYSCGKVSIDDSDEKFSSFSGFPNCGNMAGVPAPEDFHGADSQDYQTCGSQPSWSFSKVPVQFRTAADPGPEGSETPSEFWIEDRNQSDRPKGSLSGCPDQIRSLPAELGDFSVETQCAIPEHHQSHEALLQRSQSEGTLVLALGGVLLRPSFGSDPGSIQDSPGPDRPSAPPLAPPPPLSSSPLVALSAFPPLANASAMFLRRVPRVCGPMEAECRHPQVAAEQQNSPHPVKPLTTAMLSEEKRSVLATGLEKLKSTINPGRSSQPSEQDSDRKKILTEGAGSYYHLTHSELVSLLVQREEDLDRQKLQLERQKVLLTKRELELRRLKPQVRDLEDYIDTLLVRIMEQKPTLLQVRSKFK
ncbi:unnamed protein product [Ophioblennius macclurei]